jgi:hypothetical protein
MATSFVIEGSLSFLRTWLHFKSSIELNQCIPHLDIESLCNQKAINLPEAEDNARAREESQTSK